MLWQTKNTVTVQYHGIGIDGTGMEIYNANCACVNRWIVPLTIVQCWRFATNVRTMGFR